MPVVNEEAKVRTVAHLLAADPTIFKKLHLTAAISDDGRWAAVGGNFTESGIGKGSNAVYVFEKIGLAWAHQTTLTPEDTSGDIFSSGDTLQTIAMRFSL